MSQSDDYQRNSRIRKKRRGRKKAALVFVPIIIVVLIFAIVFIAQGSEGKTKNTEEIDAGVAYLTSLASRDVANVESIRAEAEKARIEEEKAALAAAEEAEREAQKASIYEQIQTGDIDIYSIYGKSSIFGDSRAAGFSWSGTLDSINVCAAASMTLRNMPEFYEQMMSVNPSYVFINYGMNDIGIGYWNDVEEWCAEFTERLADLREMVPYAEIYIVSCFPVTDPAFELSELWYHIDEWNAGVVSHCPEWGISYIDMTEFAYANMYLYEDDGIHFAPEIYPMWAEEMVVRMYQ